MFTILDYSSALEYSIIRRYTNIVYYCILLLFIFHFVDNCYSFVLSDMSEYARDSR